jgi:hypothetical protein
MSGTASRSICLQFKLNLTVVVLLAVFLGFTLVYFWVNVAIYIQNRRKIANLIVALFEIDKRDIEHYISDLANFEAQTKKFWVERNNMNEKNINFSSHEDNYQSFQTKLNKRSDDLKKSIVQKIQISCWLIRPYRSPEAQRTVQPAVSHYSSDPPASANSYFGMHRLWNDGHGGFYRSWRDSQKLLQLRHQPKCRLRFVNQRKVCCHRHYRSKQPRTKTV